MSKSANLVSGFFKGRMVNKEAGDRIRIKLSLADQVGAAFHQNAIPIVNELIVENRLGRGLQDLKLEVMKARVNVIHQVIVHVVVPIKNVA